MVCCVAIVPAHKAGKIKLCVICGENVVSKEEDFEFVNPTESVYEMSIRHDDWMSISEQCLIHLLRERITAVAEIMGVEDIFCSVQDMSLCDVEEKIIDVCKKLMTMQVVLSLIITLRTP